MDLTNSTGSISLQEFFSYGGRAVRNLSDFWRWRADQITEELQEMLDELQDFIKEIRQNENVNQKEMAAKLSDPLKSLAAKNGIKLENASLAELKQLEKILQDKIIELLKLHAARAVDQSDNDKPTTTTNTGNDKKDVSLSEPVFTTKILYELLDPRKSVSDTTTQSSKSLAAYFDSAIHLQDNNIETYA